jgi:tripartite-type tricarboxylate transporter receptor subunit TctC
MVVAPAKTPAPIVERLHREFKDILAAQDTNAQIANLSLLPMEMQPISAMQTFVKSEIARWGKVVQQAGIAGSE